MTGLDATATKCSPNTGKPMPPTGSTSAALGGALLAIPSPSDSAAARCSRSTSRFRSHAILANFGLDLPPHARIRGYFALGISVYGMFAAFTFYLPELFPTRLRGARRRLLLQLRARRRRRRPIPGGRGGDARRRLLSGAARYTALGRRHSAHRARRYPPDRGDARPTAAAIGARQWRSRSSSVARTTRPGHCGHGSS